VHCNSITSHMKTTRCAVSKTLLVAILQMVGLETNNAWYDTVYMS
jgi:hypothetical protein